MVEIALDLCYTPSRVESSSSPPHTGCRGCE